MSSRSEDRRITDANKIVHEEAPPREPRPKPGSGIPKLNTELQSKSPAEGDLKLRPEASGSTTFRGRRPHGKN
jgi:hypothetical protein